MIYFLINNNYHFYDLELLIKDSEFECALIQVPHTLAIVTENPRYSKIYNFEYFYKGFLSLFNFKKISKIHKQVDIEIKVHKEDVLFVYSDYEILNQYIIAKFKKAGCKVYILEDGLATALVYNLTTKPLPFKQRLELLIFRYLLGYSYTEMVFENENYYPVINDQYVDGVCFYLETKIKRNIPIYYLKNNTKRLEHLQDNVAVFLNQDTYLFDQSEESYFEDLQLIFSQISKNFSKIIFKFHPRETEEKKKQIKLALNNYVNIEYIENKIAVEDLIRSINPKYAISYYSSSLKNLFFLGVEPVFIYHLLPSISNNEFSIILTKYLTNLNYTFLNSFEELSPKYNTNLSMVAVTNQLKDLI
ncbi:polysialyltransferase family glycosyltransferase [Nubsella zeaxanthinifaciens]|uniref:polysialyltransferase family glycosyltransferase n=1 Tax=Nubsella zeaxanthinifaciens TaxID=392412 RepID=UPI003D0759FE